MSDLAITAESEITQTQQERRQDIVWILSLYGTAIGAGTLFLPIDAGLNGIWPVVIMAILAFPLTYFSHQALCHFVLSGSTVKHDITDVVDEHFGKTAGKVLTLLYFASIFPILLMYSVAITNTTNSFIINQLHVQAPPRALLALVLVSILMMIVHYGQQMVLKSMSILVYPFIGVLIALSLYLIPHWNSAIFHATGPSSKSFLMTLWMVIPVMVFSFSHTPIISPLAVNQRQRFGNNAHKTSSKILKCSHIMMVVTVMFFVISCVLTLSPTHLAMAKQQNISILSYLANYFQTPLMAYAAPLIAFVAISKSFLGHYLGASEGLHGLLSKTLRLKGEALSHRSLKYIIEIFIVLSCWVVATINPNILTMIETLSGPIIAMFLFLMPMYAIAKVPAMRQHKRPLINGFVTAIGFIAIAAMVYSIWESIAG